MRERMFSMQSLHQDSTAASGKLGADGVSSLDAYYIRENYQVRLYYFNVKAHGVFVLYPFLQCSHDVSKLRMDWF